MGMSVKSGLKRVVWFVLLLGGIVAAGTVSGLIVMQVALRGSVDAVTPSVEGDEVVNALEKVTKAGLNLKIISLEYDDDKPRNVIITQIPKAGTSMKHGRDVRVVISRGPREFDMPDLTDLSLRQGTNSLQEKGISLAAVSKAHSDTEEGKIISQYPPAGSHVTDLSQVELLVSLGDRPKTVMMPDFTGMQIEQAKKDIVKAGFAIKNVVYENRAEGTAGMLVSHSPPPGMPVEAGAEITLAVLKPSQSPGKPTTFTMYSFTLPTNAEDAAIKAVQESKGVQKEIYSHNHHGGDTVSLMVETDGPTIVRVYLNEKLMELKQF